LYAFHNEKKRIGILQEGLQLHLLIVDHLQLTLKIQHYLHETSHNNCNECDLNTNIFKDLVGQPLPQLKTSI
jgi:hypothetical protein